MINAEFIKETDKLIEKIKERGIRLENGNVLVAKVKTDRMTKGGLYMADDHAKREDYKNGFARILALPPMTEDDAKLSVGDYILHSHESRYKVYPDAIREVLDYIVEDDLIFSVQDNEVILTIKADQFK